MTSTVYSPSIPYVGPLPEPLYPGHVIHIQGAVKSSPVCFAVNLQNGASRNDIALHLSPVFSSPPRVVRNTFQNQQWGPEESHGSYFPLSDSQNFEIMIVTEAEQFKIVINGHQFAEFHHRMPFSTVTHIAIDGDVAVNKIAFESSSSENFSSAMPGTGGPGMPLPIGFINPSLKEGGSAHGYPGPHESSQMPYPSGGLGPQPTSPYSPPSPSRPYAPHSPSHPYGPPPGGSPYPPPPAYSPHPSSSPYGPPPGGSPYGVPPHGGYPTSTTYPTSPSGYPTQPSSGYPTQPGPYPGTRVVYPEKEKSSSGGLSGLATGATAAALASGVGAALMGRKGYKHKKKKGYGLGPLGGGIAGSLLGSGTHGKNIGGIPIGGALAGGAAALGGAYMMNKVMKPKKMKMKKMYKHGFGRSSSSSSSSSD